MKSSEINPIKSDSIEIDCQGIFDAIISLEMEFDGNEEFDKYLRETFDSLEELLLKVNDIELFSEMVDIIFRFKYRHRELKAQLDFVDDENILNSPDMQSVLSELSKFSEII